MDLVVIHHDHEGQMTHDWTLKEPLGGMFDLPECRCQLADCRVHRLLD